MLLDRPASALYRHHVDLYRPMRVLCCDYTDIVRVGVAIVAIVTALEFARLGVMLLAAFAPAHW